MKTAWIAGIFLIISGMTTNTGAVVATSAEMEQVCQSWLKYIVNETGSWAGETEPRISDIIDITSNDTLLGRFYKISPSGYIVVPALKELAPIKAYSEEYSFAVDDADGFGLMLKEVLQNRFRNYARYYGSLEAGYESKAQTEPLFGPDAPEKWEALTSAADQPAGGLLQTSESTLDGLGPLLSTAWHQSYPYNKFCPVGDGGDTCLVGCVATAAAQIIYYHMWPPFGQGSTGYYWGGDQSCDGNSPGKQLNADFSDPYEYGYDTDGMAELCYEMGVAFNMDYGVCASGAYTMDGVNIFPDYFRYDENTNAVYREFFNETLWFNWIKGQINRGLPTLYRISAHAMVCDGWREAMGLNQVHMNYGWGGSHNAWYTVDELHCDWEGCDPMVEAMVSNIVPLTGVVMLSSENMSDAAGGDGDGLAEAGETIDITLTVANYGGDGISNLNMEMFIDDASINIINGASSILYIPPDDSADNSSNPFQFEVPADYIPRIDSIYFALSWDAGGNTKVDTIITERIIGGSSILLVKDDANDTLDVFYLNNFSKMRIPYDVWVQTGANNPDSSDLMAYNIVIWYTGDYRSNLLNSQEIEAMKGFLNHGGNLFLTGQGIAAQLSTQDPDFLNNYLKTEYIATDYIPIMHGLDGGYIFSLADTLAIYSNGGASNQTQPDHVSALGEGISGLKYFNSANNASVSYSGSYKSVFFSFGFEAITATSGKFVNQDTVLTRILNFFNYQYPVNAPQITNIVASPGDQLNLTEHIPDIHWSYVDPQGYPETQYHIQIGTDGDWAFIENWEVGPVSGSDTVITYAGAGLIDGESYFIRIRAYNGSLWSGWQYRQIEMNAPPTLPSNLTPNNMSGVTDDTPGLTFNNASDPNFDQVYYSVEVYDDPDMTTLITANDSVPRTTTVTTVWNLDVTLSDDEDYYWRARANDGYEPSDWTDLASFWVNSLNSLPTDFSLVSPADGIGAGTLPHFIWQQSIDSDPFDTIYYSLYCATNPAFFQAIAVHGLTDTEYTAIEPLTDTMYYWKVRAMDQFYGEKSSSTFTLYTYIRGDANSDGTVNVGDIVFLMNFIFKGGEFPASTPEGDANCDGAVNVGDAVHILYYIFQHGPAPQCN